ncbi:GIY-YIG nuclease family protein [Bosea sp. TAF32]|uniref:GIY-YIG nuclease family protein n=1 Tax=Bosea sp. TAF32 TaxID=3237482 RepID=UPI003F91D01B
MSEKHVYVIEAQIGLIKIGCSRWPAKRAAMVSAHSPCPVRLVAVLDGGHPFERELHRRFAGSRGHGEWFRKEGAVAEFFTQFFGEGVDTIPAWSSFDRSPGNPHDIDLRTRRSLAAKERWADPEYRARHVSALRKSRVRQVSYRARAV